MFAKLRSYFRQHHWGMIATFLVLTGGTAYAVNGPLAGTNTVGSQDIINAEVRSPDIRAGAVLPGKVSCPRGTVRTVGICIEKRLRTSSRNLFSDQNVCANRGRRLLSFGELRPALREGKIDPIPPPTQTSGSGEWTSDVFGEPLQTVLILDHGSILPVAVQNPNVSAVRFRCATGP